MQKNNCLPQSLEYSLFLFLFISVFCFWPTSGNLPCVKICFPQYFGITRRYMQKPKKKLGNFYFFTTFYGQRSVTADWATRSPWSISYWKLNDPFSFDVPSLLSFHSLKMKLVCLLPGCQNTNLIFSVRRTILVLGIGYWVLSVLWHCTTYWDNRGVCLHWSISIYFIFYI